MESPLDDPAAFRGRVAFAMEPPFARIHETLERLAPLGLGEDQAAAVRQAIDSGIEAAATAAVERQRVLKTKLISSGSLRRLIK